jgi:hypothetical protein
MQKFRLIYQQKKTMNPMSDTLALVFVTAALRHSVSHSEFMSSKISGESQLQTPVASNFISWSGTPPFYNCELFNLKNLDPFLLMLTYASHKSLESVNAESQQFFHSLGRQHASHVKYWPQHFDVILMQTKSISSDVSRK